MAGYRSYYHIDGERLKSEISKRGLTGRAVSREMGYSSEYISQCVHEGRISRPGMKMLETLFHIKPEDIAPNAGIQSTAQPAGGKIPKTEEYQLKMLAYLKIIYEKLDSIEGMLK